MQKRIIELREALHLSQADFAKKLGLTRSWLSNVELGIRDIQERHILLILSAFPQVSEEWLRHGTGQMFIQDDNPVRQIMQRYNFPDIVKQFLEAYNRLDPDEQRAVLKYTTELVTAIVGNGEARAITEEEAIDAEAIDAEAIEAEVEAYRQQLLAQKKTGSYRSDGTEGTGLGIG